MANFFSGMIKGGVLAGVALVTASVLLPARPKIPPLDVASSAPVDPAPQGDQPAPVQPEPVPPAPVQPETAQPAATETPQPVAPETATPQPAPADVAAEPAPALAKEALLDPSPEMSEPNGAKMVTAPAAGSPPKIADESMAPQQPIAPDSAEPEPAEPEPVISNAPPLQKYAATFDDPGTKPLFAVILKDTGAPDLDRAALAALPFPVTFAIDPEMENATGAMAIYRAAGKEVVILTAGLPNGATAQDLEQSFQTYDTILPETVAVMGPAAGGFQDNAVLSKLIVPVIAAQGRGLITFDRGLNSAAQNAVRDGLANGSVFRQVDGAGESVPVIRRYLDRAVFKAAQDGAAMVMGETSPDTITALTEWSLEGKASDVTLAPVSAILR